MNVNSVSSTSYNQMFQSTAEKSGGQIVRQQAAPPQGPAEENQEDTSVQSAEVMQSAEGTGSKSLDFYA